MPSAWAGGPTSAVLMRGRRGGGGRGGRRGGSKGGSNGRRGKGGSNGRRGKGGKGGRQQRGSGFAASSYTHAGAGGGLESALTEKEAAFLRPRPRQLVKVPLEFASVREWSGPPAIIPPATVSALSSIPRCRPIGRSHWPALGQPLPPPAARWRNPAPLTAPHCRCNRRCALIAHNLLTEFWHVFREGSVSPWAGW